MRKEYDFSKAKKNPYAKKLNKLKANAEAAKEVQAKAARLKEIEEIKAILNSMEPSPALKRLTGVFTEARLEQMAKEDPYVRYILTKKYE
jgi:hypothetical protein